MDNLEEQLANALAEEIQKEIDGDIIWQLTEEKDWPYRIAFVHFNAVKPWLDNHYSEGIDYVYRTGYLYFKEQKVYTWFHLRWSEHIPYYRRA